MAVQNAETTFLLPFQSIDSILDAGGARVAELAQEFLACPNTPIDASKDDQETFMSDIAGFLMEIVQYNNEFPSNMLPNIDTVCQYMTGRVAGSGDTPLKSFQSLFRRYSRPGPPTNCTDYSFKTSMEYLMNTTKNANDNMRPWLWQTCTQFGYYQTCDVNTRCPFSKSRMPLSSSLEICQKAFGVSSQTVNERVSFTNGFAGGQNPQGSRVLFVNGSVDPWHMLSVLKDLTSSLLSVFIQGTAHCANMSPSRPSDPPALTIARQQIEKQVGIWLQTA